MWYPLRFLWDFHFEPCKFCYLCLLFPEFVPLFIDVSFCLSCLFPYVSCLFFSKSLLFTAWHWSAPPSADAQPFLGACIFSLQGTPLLTGLAMNLIRIQMVSYDADPFLRSPLKARTLSGTCPASVPSSGTSFLPEIPPRRLACGFILGTCGVGCFSLYFSPVIVQVWHYLNWCCCLQPKSYY